jgi:two-component system sensor histidine kinase KdpD
VRPQWELVGVVTGAFGVLVVTFALLLVRDEIVNANAALALVVPVLLAAVIGGRWAGSIAVAIAVLAFDFFFTRPYLSLTMDRFDDVETALILLVVSLIAAEVGIRSRRTQHAAATSKSEVDRLYRVAEIGARAEDPVDVVSAAQAELIALLDLERCEYEAEASRPLPRLERTGALRNAAFTVGTNGEFVLPGDGVELPVAVHGGSFGRFVLHGRTGSGTSLEGRRVAIALADQVGLALAATRRLPSC